MVELPLTKANRLKLAQAFRACPRVDFSIECVIEGQIGNAFADQAVSPEAYCIHIGPFWYFAGDPLCPGSREMMERFPAYNLLMPSTAGWVELAQDVFAGELKSFPRYQFTSARLNPAHLEELLSRSPVREQVVPLTVELASGLAGLPESYFDPSDFDSIEDFIERSFGFTAVENGNFMGVAYGSLVCSQGIEVSIYIEEPYRRKGVATALACRLLLESLRRGLRPNWDAANPESCRLAEKLGYDPAGSYLACYHSRD